MVDDHDQRGWALAEMIVLLAVVGILLGLSVWRSQGGLGAAGVAQELVRVIVTSRWSAVHEGLPRTLLVSPFGGELRVVAGSFTCDSDASAARLVWSAPPRTFVGWPTMGLAFAADGRPRRCDGSGVGNTTILIEGSRGDRAAVIVASLGRVRWERR